MLFLRFACLLLLFGVAAGHWRPARAQAEATASEPVFVFEHPRRKKVRVPIHIERNLLVVSGLLNGRGPFNFLLDTGVSTSLITSPEIAQAMHFRHGENFRVVGAGGSDTGLLAYKTDSVRLTLEGIEAPCFSPLVLSEDVLNLSSYVGVPIHGILGSELFSSFVVTLRTEDMSMLLTKPAAFRAPKNKGWASLPLSIEKNKAYFTATVQLADTVRLPVKLVLDTGASHALSLETDSDPRMVPPAKRLPTELGRGLTGMVRGYLGRVQSLCLGKYTLPSVLTSFPDAADVHRRVDVPRNGNVGFELLKRFSLIIDYPHNRMLLRPNMRFRDAFEHDMCGADFLAYGSDFRRYLVVRVEPNSPAALAGLQPDDELISINFLPANVFSLTQLGRIMHSEDGRVLLMVLRRPDGALHTTNLRLKRQI